MTRNADLDCRDLFGCDHAPMIALVRDGALVAWACTCGAKEHIVGHCQCEHCARVSTSPTEPSPAEKK